MAHDRLCPAAGYNRRRHVHVECVCHVIREAQGRTRTEIAGQIVALGHDKTCWMNLHEKNKSRQCTCWQMPVLEIVGGPK